MSSLNNVCYTKEFEDFVEQGLKNQYFVGTGNPNSKILFIGKESAISLDDEAGLKWYRENAISWKNHIDNHTCECLSYRVDENCPLKKGWGRNTWSKYQKLSDYIFEKKSDNFEVNFLEKIFTTEINDSPNKTTSNADKTTLNYRKNILKNSKFIQSFPVVVLACSNYIVNNDEIREIDDIFGVSYDGDDTGKHVFSSGNWFFIHHSHDNSKLVVHTRQLSANVIDEMLKELGLVVRNHLDKYNLL
jgi:hypothetical protein